LPAWADEHAATLLAGLGPRWQHVRGVARPTAPATCARGHERVARLIADHSARREAEALGLAPELAAVPREDSATADALTYRDMTTSPTGHHRGAPRSVCGPPAYATSAASGTFAPTTVRTWTDQICQDGPHVS
jgi:hypothetical protein